jgi:hypothetical protein
VTLFPMRILRDYANRTVRLTDERLAHILERPEMVGQDTAIEEVVRDPEVVVESLADPEARLYYRFHLGTVVGDKYLCVVVKFLRGDAFVLTAYFTDKVKRGRQIWPREE